MRQPSSFLIPIAGEINTESTPIPNQSFEKEEEDSVTSIDTGYDNVVNASHKSSVGEVKKKKKKKKGY